MKNNKIFKKWMSLFGEIFDREIDNILRDEYWEFLQPYTDEQCEKAFNKLFQTAKTFPKLNDFIIVWKRIEFEKIYKNINKNSKCPEHLPGIHEKTNLEAQKIGYDVPIVMIGEPIERKRIEN